LALKRAYKTVKKVGNRERQITNDILHQVSRAIVKEALENDSMIVLGKLKGIRKNGRGRRFNRKLNNVPISQVEPIHSIQSEMAWN
jgi:IS605 OrfB family transposase